MAKAFPTIKTSRLSMKKSRYIRIVYLLSGLLIASAFNSCKTTQQAIDYKDLSYLYNPTKSPINPLYTVVNQTDESSVLTVRFAPRICFSQQQMPRE